MLNSIQIYSLLQRNRRDTVIFVLQNLEFVISKEKSCFKLKKVMEFLRFIINSELMTIYLPPEKVGKIITCCKKHLRAEQVTIKEMMYLLVLLTSTYQAVLPGPLHYRLLQRQQIRSLNGVLRGIDILDKKSKIERRETIINFNARFDNSI